MKAPPAPSRIASSKAAPCSDVIACDARPVTRPLHIACALGGTDKGRSGIGTYVRELLPALVEQLHGAGGKLTVFGHGDELAAYRPTAAGAEFRRLRGVPLQPAFNALWHLARAAAFARRCRADVLLLPAANRRIAFSSGRIPTVAVVHDLAQLRVTEKYDTLRMVYFRRCLLPAFRMPELLVAVSSATRDDLVDTLGIAADRVHVVYNGVNAGLFRAVDPASDAVRSARRATGLHERPYLLYPARLEHPGKNHVRLLQAFARSGLATTHTLALSGADWGARELIERTVRDLKLVNAVKFLGFVSTDQLPSLVSGSTAVLMLGLHEGFGLPALEGLSAGRAVCVSSTGALPEVVGSYGVQCDPFDETSIANALLRVILDADLRGRCEREGPAWAERFTWARTARGVLEACHEAVG